MKDHDLLADRMGRLGQNAPEAAVNPLDDVRRGQRALRHRRAVGAAGITVTLAIIGVASATLVLPDDSARDTPIASTPSESTPSPSTPTPSTPDSRSIEVSAAAISALCQVQADRLEQLNQPPGSQPTFPRPRKTELSPSWENPAVAPQLAAYQQAAALILDPSGTHLDSEVSNVQFGCNPANDRLTSLGTKLGWSSSGALGVVRLEVVTPEQAKASQIIMSHEGWIRTNDNLPTGISKAWVTDYEDGRAVYVERQDGLTVAVDANGKFGNNVSPGSPSAADLPTDEKLLQLAASTLLGLPNYKPA